MVGRLRCRALRGTVQSGSRTGVNQAIMPFRQPLRAWPVTFTASGISVGSHVGTPARYRGELMAKQHRYAVQTVISVATTNGSRDAVP